MCVPYPSYYRLIPDFKVDYEPDFRQKIADAWPRSIDDTESRHDWGLEYNITVDDLTKSIMDGIAPEYKTAFPALLKTTRV